MASIFEKTMQACLENKKSSPKKSAKAKSLVEKKAISKKFVTESEDTDIDEEEMATADDIMAVIDPELDADEMTSVAQGFQQLIDDTPENEIPETDEYVDDNIYGCPICGQKFFWDGAIGAGDTCPVCGEESADGFVKAGEVKATGSESEESDEDKSESTDTDTKKKKSDSSLDDSDWDLDGEEIEFEIDEEAKKPVRKESSKPMKRSVAAMAATKAVRSENKRRVTRSNMNLDEKSFNPYLTKFVRENYENARSFEVVGARQKGNKLTLECQISFKSGKVRNITLEGRYDRKSRYMLAKDNGIFKCESKKAPFMFKVRTIGNVIKCEGLKYDFTTSTMIKNESKKVQVSGSYLSENKRVRKPMTRRAVESRRVARRPLARRSKVAESRVRRPLARRAARPVTESRKAIRRPSTRRVTESRRVVRRPSTSRVAESRKLARNPITRRVGEGRKITRRPVRSEGARVTRRPSVARKSVRGESARRRTPVARRPMRSEGARRTVARRSIRR